MTFRSYFAAAMIPALLFSSPGCFIICSSDPRSTEVFETQWESWQQEEEYCNLMVAGECQGGRLLFLYRVDVDTATLNFFDGSTGDFLRHELTGALCPAPPNFLSFDCQDGVITEVACGGFFELQVGDDFNPRSR